MKSFYDWVVKKYLYIDTPWGDFARDVSQDEAFPKRGGYKKILTYLHTAQACDECVDVFKQMWKAWERWKVKNA